MKIICDCGNVIESYDNYNLNGDKIWECEECGKTYVADEIQGEEE